MKNEKQYSRRYQDALCQHLKKARGLDLARSLGTEAVTAGIETLTLARIHQEALSQILPPATRTGLTRVMRQTADFFTEVLMRVQESNGGSALDLQLESLKQNLAKQTGELAVSNRELKDEIARREGVERALQESQRHHSRLLRESNHLQEQLRFLSHEILSTQEEERKKISRELHDEIAATLSIIHVELSGLKLRATGNSRDLRTKIETTQKLVQDAVDVIHRFARDLRPTALDDLGLIPALHSFTKTLSKQSGMLIRVIIFAGVEALDNETRTVLYRVSQEALTNVAKHAAASHAEISIAEVGNSVLLKIKDNGKSFNVERAFYQKGKKRLGLLGMRERVEMVGGIFSIESAQGQGTTISAKIPARTRGARNRRS